ncbi:MAG: hypothetical protein Q7V58_06255 [Actinomycetota bacterium]|nr:hypothetical protein [Actinomycetota bacterium]
MAITHGMDIAAVRQLAAQLRTSAADIDTMTATLTSMLSSTPWLGADRTNFDNDWSGTYTPQLKAISQALVDFAGVADAHANMQESTSQT